MLTAITSNIFQKTQKYSWSAKFPSCLREGIQHKPSCKRMMVIVVFFARGSASKCLVDYWPVYTASLVALVRELLFFSAGNLSFGRSFYDLCSLCDAKPYLIGLLSSESLGCFLVSCLQFHILVSVKKILSSDVRSKITANFPTGYHYISLNQSHSREDLFYSWLDLGHREIISTDSV